MVLWVCLPVEPGRSRRARRSRQFARDSIGQNSLIETFANGRVVHRKGFAKTYSTNVVEGA